MRKFGLKIFLFIFVVLAMLVAGEIIFRWRGVLSTDMDKFDKETGLYILKPSSEYQYKTQCFDTAIKANSQGFHDEEFSLDKPDDVFRIVILGDSFVEAKPVDKSKSFHAVLEEELNKLPDQKKKFEVYAFGKGGNGAFRSYLYLNQYALRYKPDLVILGFLAANDFREDYEMKSQILDKEGNIGTNSSQGEKLINKSVLLSWLNFKWRLMKNNLSFYFRTVFLPKEAVSQVPFDLQVFLKDYPESWQKIWDLEKNLVGEFDKKSKENNSKFLLVSFNDIWRAHQDLLPRDQEFSRYLTQFDLDFEKPEKIFSEFSANEGISYLNLVAPLKERIEKEKQMTFYYPCDAHWNETGNRWAGELLAQYLAANQYLIAK